MKRVLLLYASFGEGHIQVTSALEDTLSNISGIQFQSIDCFRQTNLRVARWNERMYEFLTKWAPSIYGMSYHWTAKLSINHPLWALLGRFSKKAAWHAIESFQPDVVLQVFPDHALRALPPGLPYHPKVGIVLTDFAIHSRWFHRGADFVCIPTIHLQSMAQSMVPPTIDIVQTGIPIRSQFSLCRKVTSVPSKSYMVIATGGRGVFPDLIEVIAVIRNIHPDLQVVVLCGRNEVIRARVEQEMASDAHIQTVGFDEHIADWYQHAVFAVVKAGGLTIAECHAAGCPMIFYRPLAGQESVNASMCRELGTGEVVQNLTELRSRLRSLTSQRLAEMNHSCCENARIDASNVVVQQLMKYL